MSDAQVVQRLYVAGLTPSITAAHLRDRFASFGTVKEVEEMTPNALGDPRPFAYLTISTTPLQLKKCLNIMSGSTWRGAHLRIAPAKPSYQARRLAELNTPVEVERKKAAARRRRIRKEMGEEVGKEAQDMRVVTLRNYASKKFWSQAEDGTLIRPIAIRPSHPLPAVPGAAKPTIVRNPPSRARRRVINPLLWGSVHLTEARLLEDRPWGEPVEEGARRGEWVFEDHEEDEGDEESFEREHGPVGTGEAEEGSGDEDEDAQVVIGVWKRLGGDGEDDQVVRVKRRRLVSVDEDDALDLGFDINEFANGSDSGSDLFGRREGRASVRSDDGGGSAEHADEDEDGDGEGSQRSAQRSTSPLFPARRAESLSPEAPAASSSASSDDAQDEKDIASASSGTNEVHQQSSGEDEVGGSVSGESESESGEGEPAPPASPLFVKRQRQTVNPLSESAGSSTRPQPRSASPLFASRAAPNPTPSSSTSTVTSRPRQPAAVKPASTPTSTPSAARPLRPLRGVPDQILKQVRAERSRDLGLLAGFLGSGGEDDEPLPKVPRNEWAGFEEEDEDDEFEGERSEGVMRIRGGEGVEGENGDEQSGSEEEEDDDSDDSDASDDSDDSDDSSEDSEDSEDSEGDEEKDTEASTKNTSASVSAQANPTQSSLKSLFAPTPSSSGLFSGIARDDVATSSLGASGSGAGAGSGGFSLLATLADDIEMEELDIPLALPRLAGAGAEPEPELQLLPASSRAKFDPDPEIPMFFPRLDALYQDPKYAIVKPRATPAATEGEGAGQPFKLWRRNAKKLQQNPQAQIPSMPTIPIPTGPLVPGGKPRRWGPDQPQVDDEEDGADDAEGLEPGERKVKPFHARETDEAMKVYWEKKRLELTREWKKRAREGRKHRKRRGGVEED